MKKSSTSGASVADHLHTAFVSVKLLPVFISHAGEDDVRGGTRVVPTGSGRVVEESLGRSQCVG